MSIVEEVLGTLHRQEGILVIKDEKHVQNILDTLNFLRKNVLNISDVTRTKKLTEILNSFAGKKSEEVFIVQNSKSKDSQGALVDVDYLLELLKYKLIFEQALEDAQDEILLELVSEREGAPATRNIGDVAAHFNLTWEEIMEAKERVRID